MNVLTLKNFKLDMDECKHAARMSLEDLAMELTEYEARL